LNLAHVRTESDPGEGMGALLATLEDWRFAAVESLANDDGARAFLCDRYRALLSAVAADAAEFRDWVACAEGCFPGEDEILAALRTQAALYNDSERIKTMVESSRRLLKALGEEIPDPRIVVFASSERMAENFHTAASEMLASATCLLLARPEDEDVVERFRCAPGPTLMVTDKSAEEGLNLSFTDAIVHLDLPLSAARIEQRIGRLDRYGRRQGNIRHRIFLPSDDDISPWAAWFALLAQGFFIFNQSISDVQFLLDDFERETFETLLMSGPTALVGLTNTIRVRIGDERRSQDEQYALDRIALAEEPVETSSGR
jgi:ATP-dependent helicase HepA